MEGVNERHRLRFDTPPPRLGLQAFFAVNAQAKHGMRLRVSAAGLRRARRCRHWAGHHQYGWGASTRTAWVMRNGLRGSGGGNVPPSKRPSSTRLPKLENSTRLREIFRLAHCVLSKVEFRRNGLTYPQHTPNPCGHDAVHAKSDSPIDARILPITLQGVAHCRAADRRSGVNIRNRAAWARFHRFK